MSDTTLRAIIVDDVPKAISVLHTLLDDYCPQVEVIATSVEIMDAFKKIREMRPDMVFLDIEMSTATSFDLLELFPDIDFAIVFVTAYEQYSLKALKLNAIDYLVKPVSIKELIQAVDKVVKFRNLKQTAEKYKAYLREVKASHPPVKLAVSTLEGLHFIQFENIVRLEADGKYTRIILKDQKEILASKNIKEFEQQLPDSHFCRIHRSHLINLLYVRQYVKGEGGYIVMEDGSNLKLSKNRRDAFIRRFEK